VGLLVFILVKEIVILHSPNKILAQHKLQV